MEEMFFEKNEFTLRDYFHLFFKHKLLIFSITALIFLAVTIYTYIVDPVYLATGKILFKYARGTGSVLKDKRFSRNVSTLHVMYISEFIKEAIDKTREFAQKEGYNINFNKDSVEISKIKKRLSVRMRRGGILVITFKDKDPLKVFYFLNAFLEVYSKNFFSLYKKIGDEFIESQKYHIEILKQKMLKIKREFQDFQKTHSMFKLSDSWSNIQKSIVKLESQLQDTKAQIEESEVTVKKLNEELNTLGKKLDNLDISGKFKHIQEYKNKLRMLKMQLTDLLLLYTSKHPKVLKLKNKIAAFEKRYSQATERNLEKVEYLKYKDDPVAMSIIKKIYSLKMHIINLKVRLKVLQDLIERKKSEITDSSDEALEYGKLSKKLRIATKLYNEALGKLQESEIVKDTQKINAIIVDKAVFPEKPISPNVKFNLTIGFLAGILIAISLVLLIENVDPTIRTVEEGTRKLSYESLGMIPQIKFRSKEDYILISTQPEKKLHRTLIVYHEPQSVAAESFRTLRTNIQFIEPGKIKAVMITNSSKAKGKTTIISNLAISMAYTGKEVLLVDTDMRKPMLHRLFNCSNEKGLTTIFKGENLDDCIQKTCVEGLSLLTCGPLPSNPAELLNSDFMTEIVTLLKQKYEMVLFDSPPVIAVTDPAILASKVDGVMFMICLRGVSKQQAKKGIDLLKRVNANILGLVFNMVTERDMGGYYYRYY